MLVAGSPNVERSFNALDKARVAGRIVACPVVWTEVSAFFEKGTAMEMLTDAGIDFDPFDRETSETAGKMWRAYRKVEEDEPG